MTVAGVIPAAVVAHGDERDPVVGAGADVDDRCPAGGFGGVERVVEQLLDDDVPERFNGLPGLRLQCAQLEELCGPRRGEHSALYGGSLTAVRGDGRSSCDHPPGQRVQLLGESPVVAATLVQGGQRSGRGSARSRWR